ncbi:MAG: hypothetical protein K0R50_1796 [Eubacterium sp.]|jgi:rRNA maturation protein Rpf1|nr:hypothetical protein [Eubacterium sp.]
MIIFLTEINDAHKCIILWIKIRVFIKNVEKGEPCWLTFYIVQFILYNHEMTISGLSLFNLNFTDHKIR